MLGVVCRCAAGFCVVVNVYTRFGPNFSKRSELMVDKVRFSKKLSPSSLPLPVLLAVNIDSCS